MTELLMNLCPHQGGSGRRGGHFETVLVCFGGEVGGGQTCVVTLSPFILPILQGR